MPWTQSTAYIPLQHKTTDDFALPIPTCWYLKKLKFALPPTQNIKFALPPMQTPNASQWNILRVGQFCIRLASGMSISGCCFCVGDANSTQRKSCSQWNMGLSVWTLLSESRMDTGKTSIPVCLQCLGHPTVTRDLILGRRCTQH